jgi:hypothetical protein
MKKATLMFVVAILASCGPSKEEIETKKALAKNIRYKVGNVVYLKPDSCAGVITGAEVSFNYNGINNYDSAYVYFHIRDCHGLDITAREEFIYGLKHR